MVVKRMDDLLLLTLVFYLLGQTNQTYELRL